MRIRMGMPESVSRCRNWHVELLAITILFINFYFQIFHSEGWIERKEEWKVGERKPFFQSREQPSILFALTNFKDD